MNQGIGKIQSAIGSAIEQISVTPIADRAATLAKQATAAGGKAAGAVQDAARRSVLKLRPSAAVSPMARVA